MTHRGLQSSSRCRFSSLLREKKSSENLGRQSPLVGFRSLIATRAAGVHEGPREDLQRAFPRARHVPPSGFLSLSTGCSSRSFTALFHAAATYRVPPSRGFPSRAAGAPRRCPCALLPLRCPSPPSPRFLGAQERPVSPELQGLAPPASPSPLLRCYPSQGPDPLMGFPPLPGLHSSCRGESLRLSSAHALSPPGLLARRRRPRGTVASKSAVPSVGLQRIAGQEVWLASFESCRPA
jgi:hypothetical protein